MHLLRKTPSLLLILLSMTACHKESATRPAHGESPSSDSSKAVITKRYRVPDNYASVLWDLAKQRTRDPSNPLNPFNVIPEGDKSIIQEKWPSQSLKALGLPLRDGYSMTNVPNGTFVYTADITGHAEFKKLNQSLGISVQEMEDANQ